MISKEQEHLDYISKKSDRTRKMFVEQMIEGKIFTKTKPFKDIDKLTESITDFLMEMRK